VGRHAQSRFGGEDQGRPAPLAVRVLRAAVVALFLPVCCLVGFALTGSGDEQRVQAQDRYRAPRPVPGAAGNSPSTAPQRPPDPAPAPSAPAGGAGREPLPVQLSLVARSGQPGGRTGYTAVVAFANRSASPLSEWRLTWGYPGAAGEPDITRSTGVRVDRRSGQLSLSSLPGARAVPAGAAVRFTFQAVGEPLVPRTCVVNRQTCRIVVEPDRLEPRAAAPAT
jgi:hypothetical protein